MTQMSSTNRRRSTPAPQAETQLRNADLAVRLESVMANATEHIRQERALLLAGDDTPRLHQKFRGRPVLVANRRFHWQDDFDQVKRWVKDRDPVLIGVGNGVEALLDAGYHPDVVVGTPGEISDLALHECDHVVVVTASKDDAKQQDGRFERFGRDPQWFVSTGKSSDLALLLADASDAPVIVEVGGPAGLNDRLGGSADDAASAFVTRLRLSARVVEAPVVSELTARPSIWPALLVFLVGTLAVAAAIAATPVGHEWFASLLAQTSTVGRGGAP